MENEINQYRIILGCNKIGMLDQVFLDSGSLLKDITLPMGIHSLVSPISIKAFGSFWLTIQQNSTAENTFLSLIYDGQEITFLFSGYLLNDMILLCGNTELPSAVKVLDEIMMINNEQTNHIRLTAKKVGQIRQEIEINGMNESMLNDFSALNNELINNKRELMGKNQKIESLNKELNDVNENMTMFTYSISHDLKEPVRMINSFLILLDKKYGESIHPKGKEYLHMALDGAMRLSKMMTDLLQFHQSSNLGTLESVDLNNVILEIKQMLRIEIEVKKARIISNELPVIKGSATGYRQVFQNLISNAIKFVPEGKTPLVSIEANEHDSNFIIMVKDNGIGIAENHKLDVFNLFKRLHTSQQFEGTGMGLAMVRKSMERMGGEVWLESEEGKGSTVFLSIPKNMKS